MSLHNVLIVETGLLLCRLHYKEKLLSCCYWPTGLDAAQGTEKWTEWAVLPSAATIAHLFPVQHHIQSPSTCELRIYL